MKITSKQIDNFWKKVNIKNDWNKCWEWKGTKINNCLKKILYGQGYLGNKLHPAHRISWIINCGEIPKGLLVCHTCDNPPCINPNHLFLGTNWDNLEDMFTKGRKRRSEFKLKKCKNCNKKIYSVLEKMLFCSEECAKIQNLPYNPYFKYSQQHIANKL